MSHLTFTKLQASCPGLPAEIQMVRCLTSENSGEKREWVENEMSYQNIALKGLLPWRTCGATAWVWKRLLTYLLTYLLHGAESFLRS